MEYKYFDAHSHLNLPDFKEDLENIVKNMQEERVGTITVGVDRVTSLFAVSIADKSDFLFASIGVHPVDNPDEKFDYQFYSDLAKKDKVVAIGECGLDYFRTDKENEEEKNRQREIFRQQVDISIESGKPLMIHARPSKGSMDAYEEVTRIFEEYENSGKKIKANLHFFVGDEKVTESFLKFDTTFSFPGVITFSHDYDSVIKMIPVDRILSETDSPFAAPVPYRGKRNMPLYVKEVVKTLAELKGIREEEMQELAVSNAKRFFGV